MSYPQANGIGAIRQYLTSDLPIAVRLGIDSFVAVGAAKGKRSMDWRNNLKRIIHDRKLSYKELSLRAKMDPGYVSKILRDVPDPALSKVQNLAEALNVTVDELLGTVHKSHNRIVTAPVVGEIAAGFWMDADAWDVSKYEDVPALPSRFENLRQVAWKVLGTSMDLAGIHDGSFVITVPYYSARAALTSSDIVVVEELDNGKVRRTVKQVYGMPGKFELRPRSSNPDHKPIVIPTDEEPASDGVTIRVVGLVIGTYMPIG